MSDEEEKIDWNIKLDFEIHKPKIEPPIDPPKPKVPPRDILKDRFPRILDKINLLWGSKELHQYFQDTVFMDRDKRQGFPPEVMDALGQLHNEHQRVLMRKGLIRMDVWDMQLGDAGGAAKK